MAQDFYEQNTLSYYENLANAEERMLIRTPAGRLHVLYRYEDRYLITDHDGNDPGTLRGFQIPKAVYEGLAEHKVNPNSVDGFTALWIIQHPDRHIGNWDDSHIRVVTGYSWAVWRKVFAQVPTFEAVFRSLTTKRYLVESNRWYEVEKAALEYANG